MSTIEPVFPENHSATAGSSIWPLNMASLSLTGSARPVFSRYSPYGVWNGLAPIIVPASDDPMPLFLSSSHSSWVAGLMTL